MMLIEVKVLRIVLFIIYYIKVLILLGYTVWCMFGV